MQSDGLRELNAFRDVGELSEVPLTNSEFEEMSPPNPKSCCLKENPGYGERWDKELQSVFLKNDCFNNCIRRHVSVPKAQSRVRNLIIMVINYIK